MSKPTLSKEQAILEAAEREFLEKGFAGARTVSIAEAAGVTHAMLHYYFRTKEQLFGRILEAKLQIMKESFLVAFGQPGLPLLERLRDGITRHFDFVAQNPDLPRFIVNEILSKPERYQKIKEKIRAMAGSLMYDLQQELDISARNGETEPVDGPTLLLDIVSLNTFPFIASPIAEALFGNSPADMAGFWESRRQETIELIMRRLKKK